MALSNIFREPRREITETILGAIVLAAPMAGLGFSSYYLAVIISETDNIPFFGALLFSIPFTIIYTTMLVGIVIAIFLALHKVGEDICDALERRGLHLRPRERK